MSPASVTNIGVTDPQYNRYLGDVISIYADGAGFISTLGLVDDRCVTNFNDGNLQVPPIKYRDCLFRICPQCRYAARRQFWRSVKPGQSRLVEAFVQKLSEAADVEKEQNEKEKLKQHGQEVRYGQLIQLLHVKSNKYLTGMVVISFSVYEHFAQAIS